jgi:2-polyprenyl-3-methyl-5-hydroxy-6-metoxy-1,4-benzoquinol methylase
MKADYHVHDRLYREARAKGWSGWGGNDRIAYEHQWVEHLFSYDEVPKRGEVLELGCGEGHIARLLAEKGYQVLGVDISPTAIQWAKEKTLEADLTVEYLELDLTKSGVLQGQAFDLIVDGNCLHCIIDQDRKTFLANVHRLLKNKGLFFVFSKCSNLANDEVVEFEGKPYRYVPSRENLHRELEVAGFEIKKSEFIGEAEAHGHCTIHLTRR